MNKYPSESLCIDSVVNVRSSTGLVTVTASIDRIELDVNVLYCETQDNYIYIANQRKKY